LRREQLEQRLQEKIRKENEAVAEEVKKAADVRKQQKEQQLKAEEERRNTLAVRPILVFIYNNQLSNIVNFV
jgi:hypothetical protein